MVGPLLSDVNLTECHGLSMTWDSSSNAAACILSDFRTAQLLFILQTLINFHMPDRPSEGMDLLYIEVQREVV